MYISLFSSFLHYLHVYFNTLKHPHTISLDTTVSVNCFYICILKHIQTIYVIFITNSFHRDDLQVFDPFDESRLGSAHTEKADICVFMYVYDLLYCCEYQLRVCVSIMLFYSEKKRREKREVFVLKCVHARYNYIKLNVFFYKK